MKNLPSHSRDAYRENFTSQNSRVSASADQFHEDTFIERVQ